MIVTTVLSIVVVVLGVLFFFQEKRQQSLARKFSELVERLDNTDANMKVLAQNEETLLKDMKMMLHEFKTIEKKIKQPNRERS